MIVIVLVVGVVGLIVYAIHKCATNSAKYFEDRNLKYTGLWPALKSIYGILFGKVTLIELVKEMYERYPNEP